MHKGSAFTAVVVGFGVFTFLSLDILRELYGQSALLVVYAVLAVLTSIAAYSFIERMSSFRDESSEKMDDETETNDEDDDEKDEDVVEKEMEDLKSTK